MTRYHNPVLHFVGIASLGSMWSAKGLQQPPKNSMHIGRSFLYFITYESKIYRRLFEIPNQQTQNVKKTIFALINIYAFIHNHTIGIPNRALWQLNFYRQFSHSYPSCS